MNPLKVYGGDVQARYSDRSAFPNMCQLRAIVLASSRQEVLESLLDRGFHMTSGHLKTHWTQTANERELKVANNEGRGVVCVRSINNPDGHFMKI